MNCIPVIHNSTARTIAASHNSPYIDVDKMNPNIDIRNYFDISYYQTIQSRNDNYLRISIVGLVYHSANISLSQLYNNPTKGLLQ